RRAVLAGLLAAAACQAKARPVTREFDAQRAFGYLQAQLAFGPRIPNTPAHDSCGAWILAHLKRVADTVIVQDFTVTAKSGARIRLRNYIARFRPKATDRVLYLAHWDTRPRADQEQNLGAQRLPVPGANDGASGVALLLGVADALKAKPPAVGVDLLFDDGEDYGTFVDIDSSYSDVLMGARYYAHHLPPGPPPLMAVLFDMIGAANLRIPYEQNSQAFAPEVVDRVWRVADSLGYGGVFLREPGPNLIDDHAMLQRVGIHAIDVVDFDGYQGIWHTTQDTIDKVSAQSLQIVGDVAVALVR
ncbi:MAG TPA: M28 family peptidase, partial [Gemmatimonadales bacterium]